MEGWGAIREPASTVGVRIEERGQEKRDKPCLTGKAFRQFIYVMNNGFDAFLV